MNNYLHATWIGSVILQLLGLYVSQDLFHLGMLISILFSYLITVFIHYRAQATISYHGCTIKTDEIRINDNE